jgi:hypothetical protein
MKNELRIIDLSEAQRGSLCCVCEDRGAELADRDLGPVCAECFGHGMLAEKELRAMGLDEDEGLQAFAEMKRMIGGEQ